MPVTLTKKELEALLVAERAKSRTKQQQSAFMKRTLQIYNGDKKRCFDETKIDGLPYTLAEFRAVVGAALGTPCRYTGQKITVANLAADHSIPVARGGTWELSNIDIVTAKANFRKGQLTAQEFDKFCKGLKKNFAPEAVEDIFRRLSLGGKWSFGQH